MDRDRRELIRILQGAYSGELAAGLAYRGHGKSVSSANERTAIQRIEREEAVHRQRVGEMLASLGSAPRKLREVGMWMIGRTIGLSCHALGRFLPMYFAGRLESGNVVEYEDAAALAAALSLSEFEAELLVMARVEKEHELFFLSMAAGHRLLPLMQRIFGWGGCETEAPAASGLESEPGSAGILPFSSWLRAGVQDKAGRMPALPGSDSAT
jgi:demethoxyubiquinone hydroxylase (CLK1/Coq7/Cat5 family)